MFVLVEMKDTICIRPWLFHLKLEEAAIEALNKKFANKLGTVATRQAFKSSLDQEIAITCIQVVHNVGLCTALWDITKLEDSFIFPGDGSSHTVVHFRYVVFRPFMDEVLVGKIRSCSKEGVHVSMGFFDDILITADALQHPSRFDETEQLWVWQYETDEDKHDLFMDVGEEIRFRLVDESFIDTTPTGPDSASSDLTETRETESKKAPYTLIGSINEPGLGLLSWWNNV